jgi:hypothetical protein
MTKSETADRISTPTVKADQVLCELAQFYRTKMLNEYPGIKLTEQQSLVAGMKAFEAAGQAIRHIDDDGNVTWKATPMFLSSIDLPPGPLVEISPKKH